MKLTFSVGEAQPRLATHRRHRVETMPIFCRRWLQLVRRGRSGRRSDVPVAPPSCSACGERGRTVARCRDNVAVAGWRLERAIAWLERRGLGRDMLDERRVVNDRILAERRLRDLAL